MERPNWKMILPLAAVTGFVLTGFWGLLLGPIAAVPIVSWQRRRDGAASADDEERRLAEFMAETLAATARKKRSSKETVKPTFEETRARAGQMDEAELFEAFAAARLALIENERDAQAAASFALLARRLAPGEALLPGAARVDRVGSDVGTSTKRSLPESEIFTRVEAAICR